MMAKSRIGFTLNVENIWVKETRRENHFSLPLKGVCLVAANILSEPLGRVWPVINGRYSQFKVTLISDWQSWSSSVHSATFFPDQLLAFWTRRKRRCFDDTLMHIISLQAFHRGTQKYQKCAQKQSSYRFTPQHFGYDLQGQSACSEITTTSYCKAQLDCHVSLTSSQFLQNTRLSCVI